jgi:hypothetical protein
MIAHHRKKGQYKARGGREKNCSSLAKQVVLAETTFFPFSFASLLVRAEKGIAIQY